jgi:ribosome-associated protein
LAGRKSTSTPAGAKKRATKIKSNPIQDVALAIAQAALDRKAVSVEIIDVTGKVDYADYVVVMSATSDRHANAIAKNVDAEMARKGIHAHSIEGLPQGAWVLMDFGDVIVHIFHQDTRGYYDLESLWFDAARVEVKDRPH